MNRKLSAAKSRVLEFFDASKQKVFKVSEIGQILEEQRNQWHIPAVATRSFVGFLMEAGKLSEVVFPFPRPYKRETRYVWGEVSMFVVIQDLKPGAYFSHYTAMSFHGLTEQLPKTIYLNVEQTSGSVQSGALTQGNIDKAFQRAPRMSGNVAEADGYRVCIISGKNTGRRAVIEGSPVEGAGLLRYTSLERTLIDIAVRPAYAGGVFEVKKAYELARGRASAKEIVRLLGDLEYVYPYHQAIGYYMMSAGWSAEEFGALKNIPMEYDFYLTHQMSQTDYVQDWRLHVPKGF